MTYFFHSRRLKRPSSSGHVLLWGIHPLFGACELSPAVHSAICTLSGSHIAMRIWRLLGSSFIAAIVLGCLLLNPHTTQAASYYASPTGSGTVCSLDFPCTIKQGIVKVAPGETLYLLDGTYQGAGNVIAPPVGKSGTSTAPITVQALNDGSVFIDGQFERPVFLLQANSWWIFQGFDAGNSVKSVMEIYPSGGVGSNNNVFRRICASNANPNAPAVNEHVWLIWDSADNLFEDICGFGFGRNTLTDFGSGSTRNTFRRVWLRWEGWPARFTSLDCYEAPGPAFQLAYGTSGNTLIENLISVYNPERQGQFATYSCGAMFGAGTLRDPVPAPYSVQGFIAYGYDNPNVPLNHSWFNYQDAAANIVDYFLDARSQGHVWPFVLACRLGDSPCAPNSGDRITSIRGATASNLYLWSLSNFNECTTPEACPNFYTGDGGPTGTGSRACYRYENGSLSDTPLWPWPMDDRIKAALSRAGSSALAGTGGRGYAANTVTSEIVGRYGAIPTQCHQ
jgi:hypothetical protein